MANYAFGVDVGGTTVKIGLFTTDGTLISTKEIPTRTANDGREILPDIAQAVRLITAEEKIAAGDLAGIGIGVPGPVNEEGVVDHAVNLGWGRFSIRDTLYSLTGLPVAAGNDANVAAYGEAWKGSGAGVRDLLLVTLGTGVGGGIIAGGRILYGAIGGGGEIGHLHLVDDEPDTCGCGGHGCFEQYASATGALRLTRQVLAESDDKSVLRDKDFTCKDIFDAAAAGDSCAQEAVRRYGFYLGKGLAICASILNPEVIVLGGGVSRAGDVLINLLTPSFETYVFPPAKNVRFLRARLLNEAGIYGAARMILDEQGAHR